MVLSISTLRSETLVPLAGVIVNHPLPLPCAYAIWAVQSLTGADDENGRGWLLFPVSPIRPRNDRGPPRANVTDAAAAVETTALTCCGELITPLVVLLIVIVHVRGDPAAVSVELSMDTVRVVAVEPLDGDTEHHGWLSLTVKLSSVPPGEVNAICCVGGFAAP